MNEILYWIIRLGYWTLDISQFSFIQKYKVKTRTSHTISKTKMLPTIIINHIISVICYQSYILYTDRGFTTKNYPSLILLFCQHGFFLILFDIIFYIGHRSFHHPKLYSYIHKKIHTTLANISISGYYMGIIDFLFEFIFPVYIPIYLLDSNILVFFISPIFGQINSLISHSGYNILFTPYEKGHLIQHLELNCNYDILFMDKLFSTKE